MSDALLVLNAGSSSLKFALFEAAPGLTALGSGQVEGIGAAPRFSARSATGESVAASLPEAGNHEAALAAVIAWLKRLLGARRVVAVGHRVVHGGAHWAAPALVNGALLAELDALVPLAPLHQPHNLAGIRAAQGAFPGVPQIACFDTAFHRSQPEVAERFALPEAYFAQGVRRYGFHGLSYESIWRGLEAEEPALARSRLVVAHLGNGASLCAIAGGRSQATTMGFTALDGVPMGTRCGQIDPGVLLHMLDTLGMSTAEITRVLYQESGLKGLSGVSQDVREIEAAGGAGAERALGHFAYRVRREVAALAACLGGIDALVFTAGIGENSASVRARICEGLGFLGIRLDAARNAGGAAEIGAGPVRVLVRRTDEERMIAGHTLGLLAAAQAKGARS
jgi:acetate kinase